MRDHCTTRDERRQYLRVRPRRHDGADQQFTDAIKEITAATEQFRVATAIAKAAGELSGLADSLRNQAHAVQHSAQCSPGGDSEP